APADREHHKVITAWAIHYSRRRKFAAEVKARRGARRSTMGFPVGFGARGLPYGTPAPAPHQSAPSEPQPHHVPNLLHPPPPAARAEAAGADGTAGTAGAKTADTEPAAAGGITAVADEGLTEPLTSTWSRPALAALLIPALILLIVILV